MKRRRLILCSAVFTSTVWGLGCNRAGHQELMTFQRATEHITLGAGYRLAPPDMVRVHAPQAPEVDGQARIRHDGTVHLRLLGDIRVAGLTAREAASKIELELREYYKDPQVHVSVVSYASKVFYLFGEIQGNRNAGGDRSVMSLPITGRDTIMNVLTRVPPTRNAWLTQVKIMRPDTEDPSQTQEIIIDVNKMFTTGDRTEDILLQEGDIVWVPPTPMAWVGYRIQELLQPVAPVINAYTTPASIIDAQEEYQNDDDDDGGGVGQNILGRIVLP